MVQTFKDFLTTIIGDIAITSTCSLMDIVAIISTMLLVWFIIAPAIKVFMFRGGRNG